MKENDVIQIDTKAWLIVRNLVIICVSLEVAFVLIDAFVNYARLSEIGAIRRLCNIAREDSLASWFGTTQTFMVGLTLWLIVVVNRSKQASKWQRTGWLVLAIFFTYMAIDDGAEIHERMGTAFKTIANSASGDGDSGSVLKQYFPSYTWQILFLPLFGSVGIFLLIFLWSEIGGNGSRALIIAAISCFVFAVGIDFVEGLDDDHAWNLHTVIKNKYTLGNYTVRHFSKSLEEFIEMLAMTLFWVAFAGYFMRTTENGVKFSFSFRNKET